MGLDMAKNQERANKGRIIKKMSKDDYVLFDQSVPIRKAIKKDKLFQPLGENIGLARESEGE